MEFTLLHGGLAFGAALAVIPVVLHLILRQKPKHLVFPALRLIQLRHRANRRRLQLRHLILLLLRMAVIAAMALALARPRVGGIAGASQQAPVAAVFVIDTSLSMQYRYENATRLEKAQELALELLGRLPERSKVMVMQSGMRIVDDVLLADQGRSQRQWNTDPAAAQDQILDLEPLPLSRSMSSVLAEAADVLADPTLEEQRRELYVFSDLTVGAWSPQGASPGLANVPDLAAYVLDVGIEQPKNFAITRLAASRQVLLPGSQVTLRATVEAQGDSGERVAELYLGRDEAGRPLKLGHQIIDLAPGETQEVRFTLPGLSVGLHQGRVQLVGGADGLGHDDRHYVTLEVRPRLKILIVGTNELDTAYWHLALTPSDELSSYRVDQIGPDELSGTLLDKYAVVCLINVPALSEPAWNVLSSFVSAGGGLVLLPGPATEAANYNSEQAQRLAPARIIGPPLAPDSPVYLAPERLGHPILESLQETEELQDWPSMLVYRYLPTAPSADAVTVIAYNDREPALLERAVGKGRVMMLTTSVAHQPPGSRWNELTAASRGVWMFLLLADQITQHVAGNTDERVNYLAHEPTVRLRLPSEPRPASYVLHSPTGREEQGQIDPVASELVLPVPGQLGNFQVTATPREPQINKGFSVNASPMESRLERISPAELDAFFGQQQYSRADDPDSLNIALRQTRQGMEIYPLLIALMVLLLGAEAFTAGRFYPEAETVPGPIRRWEIVLRAGVALLGLTLGALAVGWAVYRLRQEVLQSEHAVPWLYRLGEIGLGMLVLAVAGAFAWGAVQAAPKLLVRLRAVWRY